MHLDLIEHYASGKISRRNFIRRGSIIGLSMPVIGAVIAACGGDDNGGSGGASTTAGGGDTSTTVGGGATSTSGAPGTTGAGQTGGILRVGSQRPVGLDPIQMQDLGSYGCVAQCFEFLVGSDANGELAPALAESWEPNEDGTVWTFQLREATWQDGSEFTSADVAATMDRLVVAENSGLAGVIAEGAVDTSDPRVAVFTLEAANGNLPALVSNFNAQTCITPVAYETGTTLDASPNGTGPWRLARFDAATGCTYERNPDWWGGATPLDGQEYTFFEDLSTMLTAMQSQSVDALIQFSVIGGDALLNDPNFTVLESETATHRQIWMRTDRGPFVDKAVRQALALTLNREQMVQTLFGGRANIGNDHPVAPFFPMFFDGTPQRERNVDQARQLLADAGAEGLTATMSAVELQEIPQLAELVSANAAEAGITLELSVEPSDTFYGASWCPAEPADPPCSGAADIGIVDYGHRPVPDIYLNAALKGGGVWNSSQYMSDTFDTAFSEYQAAVGVEAQIAACEQIQAVLNDEVPVALPFFYNFLSGHSSSFQGIRTSAIGQMFTETASQV
ncbi:MAG: ABC transporter substrate-binding protein [Ilumatobacteraceae bacterium]